MAGLHPLTNLTGIDVIHLVVKGASLGVVIIATGISPHKLADVLDSGSAIQAVTRQPAVSVNRDDGRGIGNKRNAVIVIENDTGGLGSVKIDDFHSGKSFRSGRLAPS